jgi:hypothetical protein
MLLPYYKTKKSFQILNENYQSLAFTFSVENSHVDAEINIYADDILIFSIINPIEDLHSPHLVPLFDCKSINFEIKNVTCIFENFNLSAQKIDFINSIFSTSKLEIVNKKCENVLFLLCDSKNVDMLKICIESIRNNVKIKNMSLAIINIDNSFEVSKICEENTGLEISCLTIEDKLIHLAKGSVFTIANSIYAEKYMFLDIDTFVVNDLSELLSLNNDKINFVAEWNDNDLKLIDLFESDKIFYDHEHNAESVTKTLYGKINPHQEKSVNFLKNLIIQKYAINTGFFITNRKQLLRLQSKLEQINKFSIRYLDDDWVFREQAVVNIAASHNNQIKLIENEFNVQLFKYSEEERKKIINNIKNDKVNKVLHFNGLKSKKIMREKFKIGSDVSTNSNFSYNFKPIKTNYQRNFNNFPIIEMTEEDRFDFDQFLKRVGYIKIDEKLLQKQKKEINDFSNFSDYFLNDLEIIICVKIDSEERLTNLKKVVQHLNRHFKNRILIAEWGNESKIKFDGNYKVELFNLNEDEFNRNLLANLIYEKTDKKVILNLDSDVILNPKSIAESYHKIKERKNTICIPHNGFPVWLNKNSTNNYTENNLLPEIWNDFFGIRQNIDKTFFCDADNKLFDIKAIHNRHPGYAYMFDKKTFQTIGFENQNFNKHSCEDHERLLRFYKFGFEIIYSDYFCYHLFHSRGSENLWYFSKDNSSYREYEKIIKIDNINDLFKHIDAWPWHKNTPLN